ncbi:MAG: DUF2326 domain-containing protein [Bacteroidia bacterium]
MILNSLYTTPKQLFEPVNFINGINFIYGKKTKTTDSKKSLNGIGKSTFLDLLDFCMLSSYDSRNKRLYAAYEKGILKGISIVLEFEISKMPYAIKRGFDNPSLISFSENNEDFSEISIQDLKKKLCDLMFFRADYKGYYSNTWLRKLVPFYLKIQRPKKEKFLDPILYIKETNLTELNQYHLFLLDIDNKLSYKNYKIQTDKKRIAPVIKGIEEFISETYNLKNIPEAGNKSKKLKMEIEELEKNISQFNLSKQYEIDESKANEITASIKQILFQNHIDREKILSYNNSIKESIEISTRKIKNIYDEVNELLSSNIKKTLEEAISFRKELNESRREFITAEITKLNEDIERRKVQIEILNQDRKKIFDFLSSKNAINDLTEAFKSLSDKRGDLSNLEGQIKLYQDLNIEKNQIEQDEKIIEGQFLELKQTIVNQELEISKLFVKIYNSIYPELNDSSIFDISTNLKLDSKLEIVVLPNNEMLSKGKNQGRTLVYDLMVLFNSLSPDKNCPKFLVHDGIFDGMDKAHLVALYEFLESQLIEGKQFQYIVTYNEEGNLSENFGDAKALINKIETEAILTLTPKNKLLGEF